MLCKLSTHESLSSPELLYGGFWEYEHHISSPSHSSPPSPRHTHPLSTSRQHTFAMTFLLQATREHFSNLTACVDAIKTTWPQPHSDGLDFMKHFFYEVGEIVYHPIGRHEAIVLNFFPIILFCTAWKLFQLFSLTWPIILSLCPKNWAQIMRRTASLIQR